MFLLGIPANRAETLVNLRGWGVYGGIAEIVSQERAQYRATKLGFALPDLQSEMFSVSFGQFSLGFLQVVSEKSSCP